MTGWEQEPPTRDERRWTPHGPPGYESWNGKSPEKAFCEFAAALVALHRPAVVIETGVGQGYVTRRLARELPRTSRLLCFESDPAWRSLLEATGFFDNERLVLTARPPTAEDFAVAGVSILDSSFGQRKREIRLWHAHAQPGSAMLVHDVTGTHPPEHVCRRLNDLIVDEGIHGTTLPNPRGGFLAWK